MSKRNELNNTQLILEFYEKCITEITTVQKRELSNRNIRINRRKTNEQQKHLQKGIY